jgi:hypothetical protein
MYTPKPVDTGNIELSDDLMALAETLAEHVHDVWAEGRIREGWTYGRVRDDKKKKTPCLVPYGELPESEKEYDRNTAYGTLKLLVALGYRIEKDPF